MTIFKVKNANCDSEPTVELCLMQDGATVQLGFHDTAGRFYIIASITTEGRIRLHSGVPKGEGIEVDTSGQIRRTINSY